MIHRRVRVRGLVQGVGFRPYVWRLAHETGLRGWVNNDGDGVEIEAHGSAEAFETFLARLQSEAPRLARIDSVEVDTTAVASPDDFTITASNATAVHTAIGPDAAICPACIAEICDPADRRWRYAFTTCTHCGPRYTVSGGIPYDRSRTSLAAFPLCPTCEAEYTDPANRRFHAETTCCPTCGPQLSLCDMAGNALSGDPIASTLLRLQAGEIVAIKGLGGFHLACDARNANAVAELRLRKAREEKPFAVMGLNPASLARIAEVNDYAAALLASPAAPIVLCPKGAHELPGIAPGLGHVGVMLPSTPVHLLLWHEAAGRPGGTQWLTQTHPLLLVMTSANPQGEPLVINNDEARTRLTGIADVVLQHNREIVIRCDDSVILPSSSRGGPRWGWGEKMDNGTTNPIPLPASPLKGEESHFIRRARGYTPLPISLATEGPDVIAFGGYLKNTICVTRGREAFLSQHIGSLDNAASIGFLEETVAHLLDILDVAPQAVAHDLHPDYPSTRLALAFAAARNIPAIAIAHHHAHIAAVIAEHGISEPVLGLAIDGVGLGPDGGLWGGELLRVDGANCERLAHLAPLRLPGGDRAAREPWRMACSALHAAGRGDEIPAFVARHYPQHDGARLTEMLDKDLNCPPTTSLGRLFDAAAGLLGLRAEMRYEGQAAMELESLAAQHPPLPPMHNGWILDQDQNLSFLPLLLSMTEYSSAKQGSALFHATLAAGLAAWLQGASNASGMRTIAVAGGCALNRNLMNALAHYCAELDLTLICARQAPPNDGGLALGQAWIARHLQGE